MSKHEHQPTQRSAPESGGASRGAPDHAASTSRGLVAGQVLTPPLLERMRRTGAAPIRVVIEVRTAYPDGAAHAQDRIRELVGHCAGHDIPVQGSDPYLTTELTADQLHALVRADAEAPSATDGDGAPAAWSIHRIWPDFRSAH